MVSKLLFNQISMKVKLSTKEWIAVAVAVVFVAYSLFGSNIISLFDNNNTNIAMTEEVKNTEVNSNVDTAPAEQKPAPTKNSISRNGVIINDLVVGTGPEIAVGKAVAVHYILSLQDGTVLQNSKDFGAPFRFVYGVDSMIQGWQIGIAGMKAGGTRTIVIPPELGYGAQQAGPVPANSTLVFTIELLEVSDVQAQ